MPTLDEALAQVLNKNLSRRTRKVPFGEEEEEGAISPNDNQSFEDKFKQLAGQYSRSASDLSGLDSPRKGIRSDNIAEYNRAAIARFEGGGMPGVQQRQAQFAAEAPFRGGTPTRANSPVAAIGKGDAEGGYSLLEGLAKASGNKRLGNILSGVKSGFGSANIVHHADVGSALANINHEANWTYAGSSRGKPEGVVVPMGPSGAFSVVPSGDTEQIGLDLENAFRKQGAIRERQTRKYGRSISTRRRARGE